MAIGLNNGMKDIAYQLILWIFLQ